MAVSSVGVRLADDFDALPLFDAPPLNGPTQVGGWVVGWGAID